MARPRKNEGIRYLAFLKTLPSGSKIYYIKFFDDTGAVFSIRSSGTNNRDKAHAFAGKLLATENFRALALKKRLAKAKQERERIILENELKQAQGTEAERISRMPVVDALALFWNSAESPYLQDLADAGRPLSGHYIAENQKNVNRYFIHFSPFKTVWMADVNFMLIDEFCRQLRKKGASRYIINSAINTLRAPCTWLAARGVMPEISFKGIALPEKKPQERGILSAIELERIVKLETLPVWHTEAGQPRIDTKPRPRLPGKKQNHGMPGVGFREKLAVILGAYTGARLGELRALQWRNVDIQRGIIQIQQNYVDADGMKKPKARSARTVVISATLEHMLIEARKIAAEIGNDGPDHFVLINPADVSKPISQTTIARGWDRVLRAIGISAQEQKARNLVFHGLRHLYATRLIDAGLSPGEAAKLTGHRVLATLGRYSDHVQDETLAKAREILDSALYGKKVADHEHNSMRSKS